MEKPVLNFLDAPLAFCGMRTSHLSAFLVLMTACVYLNSLLAVVVLLALTFGARFFLKKRPKFFLRRLLYQHLPTASFFGKFAPNLIETHLKKWKK